MYQISPGRNRKNSFQIKVHTDVWNSVDSVKKVVNGATAKFGPHAAPIAEWVADNIENEIASRLGVSRPQQQDTATDANRSQQSS